MAKGILLYILFAGQILFAQQQPALKTTLPSKPRECPQIPYVRKPGDPYLWRDLDGKPEYPGGEKAFVSQILEGINISDNGAPKSLNHRIFLSFIVEPDGSLSTFIVCNDPGYGIGDEVLKSAENIGQKWNPGVLSGELVRAGYTVMVHIKVN